MTLDVQSVPVAGELTLVLNAAREVGPAGPAGIWYKSMLQWENDKQVKLKN